MDIHLRTHKLQQIPVFALRTLIYSELSNPENRAGVERSIREQWNVHAQNVSDLIKYQNREKLIQVINEIPEISDVVIDNLFEEYRYGANPSFYIFLFNRSYRTQAARNQIQGPLWHVVERANASILDEFPRIRNLVVDELMELEGNPDVIEGNYSVQRRMDFVDENQNPTSTYETLYGFFWINFQLDYVIIHSRDLKVLSILKAGISEGAGIDLANVVVTKQLKNALPFLDQADLRLSRLHDPDPDSGQYSWISVKDENPYGKGYEDLEQQYPEVVYSHYHIQLDPNKETTLKLNLGDGSLSLMGKLTATQFRHWCLDKMSQIIAKIRQLQSNPISYVATYGLRNVPELLKYSSVQKDHIIGLISQLLNLQKFPGIGYSNLNGSPLTFAAEMQRLITVQFLKRCGEQGCDEEGYFGCGDCRKTKFNMRLKDAEWSLECPSHRKPWKAALPVKGCCEAGHVFLIDKLELEQISVILPTDSLLRVISQVVDKYVPGYKFSDALETFMIRGNHLIYYQNKAAAPRGPEKTMVIQSTVNIGTVQEGANVSGVTISKIVAEELTGRSKVVVDEVVNRKKRQPDPSMSG